MSSSSNDAIKISNFALVVIAIVILGSVLRLVYLDNMAFHHDESIHAYYSHDMYKGNLGNHTYDPTYHGQFLYHYGALFFLLFGDTDTVARLPYVSFGILMFYFVWRLRSYIGSTGVIAGLLFIAFSPTLTYFSRFARNDIYMATMALGILLFSLDYLKTLKGQYLVLAAFFLALMYTCKENSYMTGFVFGSFIVFYGIYYVISYPREVRKLALTAIFKDRAPFTKLLTLYGLFSCTAFSLVAYVSHTTEFRETALLFKEQRNRETFEISILRDAWTSFMQNHPWFAGWGQFLWVLIPVIIAAILFVLYGYISRKSSTKPEEGNWFSRFAKENIALVASLLVIFTVYTMMFTNMGTHTAGMKSGVIDYLLYWMGQQGAPRIAGPPDYYIPRLLIYEPALIIFGLLAFVIYTWNGLGLVNFVAFQVFFGVSVYAYWSVALVKTGSPKSALLLWLVGICISMAIVLSQKLASLFSFIPKDLENNDNSIDPRNDSSLVPNGLRCFLIYWSVLSILIYALLEEKVPWLLVHQVLPLALLTGVFISDVWKRLGPGALRNFFAIVVGLLVVYEARTDLILNVYHPDDPRELMIYTQTDHSAIKVVEEIKEGAAQLGAEYMPPNPTKTIAFFQGHSVWPYVWYFRNYMTASSDKGLPTSDIPFTIVNTELERNMTVWAKGNYTKRKIFHRSWWPPALDTPLRISTPSMRHEMPFAYAKSRGLKPIDGWRMLWKYILYREVWGHPGGVNVTFYKRSPLVENEASPKVAEGYNNPVSPLRVIKTIGKYGKAEGEFIEPRGIAFSPDESRLYVLDAQNGRIQVFDKELNFVGWFGGPGKELGHLTVDEGDGPNGGIAVGPDGTIYVTDTWHAGTGRINRYTAEGKALSPLVPSRGDSFYFPRGLAIASNGMLYVADTGKHRIVQFNPDGSYAGALIENQLKEPVGVTVGSNGWIYVCDVGMHRVAAFSPQGNFMRQYSILGWNPEIAGDMVWIEPYVAVDRVGNVIASDSTTHTIYRFDPLGKKVTQAGGEGSGLSKLRKPKGIIIDSHDYLYIADSMNHRIIKAQFTR